MHLTPLILLVGPIQAGSPAAPWAGGDPEPVGGLRGAGGLGWLEEVVLLEGAADAAAFRAEVERIMNQLRYCGQRRVQADGLPFPAGRVAVRVSVGADGKVIDTRDAGSGPGLEDVSACFAERFARMRAKPGVSEPLTFGVDVLFDPGPRRELKTAGPTHAYGHLPPPERVSGEVDLEAAAALVSGRLTWLRYCAWQHRPHPPALDGTITLRLELGTGGRFDNRVYLERDDLGVPELSRCLAGRLREASWGDLYDAPAALRQSVHFDPDAATWAPDYPLPDWR